VVSGGGGAVVSGALVVAGGEVLVALGGDGVGAGVATGADDWFRLRPRTVAPKLATRTSTTTKIST